MRKLETKVEYNPYTYTPRRYLYVDDIKHFADIGLNLDAHEDVGVQYNGDVISELRSCLTCEMKSCTDLTTEEIDEACRLLLEPYA